MYNVGISEHLVRFHDTIEEARVYWEKALSEHLFVLCQTTMAVAIITDIISHADMLVKALKNCAPMICHLTSPRGDVHFRNKLQEQLRAQFSSFEVGHKYSLASEYLFSFMFSCILSNLNFWYEHQEECTLEQICLMSKQLISIGVSGYIENIDSDLV